MTAFAASGGDRRGVSLRRRLVSASARFGGEGRRRKRRRMVRWKVGMAMLKGRKRRIAALMAGAAALSACSESNLNSIYRTVSLDDGAFAAETNAVVAEAGPSVILDAKQRLVTNARRPDGTRIICSEPSPDVAQGISDALTAALEASNGQGASGSASFSRSSAAAVAQLGERLATIQLLRDELADLCRAYSNGAVTQTHYTLRLSKLDDKMVTLLMGEMAAGAFGRPLAAIGGDAGGGLEAAGSDAEIQAAQGRVDTAQVEADEAAVALASQREEENQAAATAESDDGAALRREQVETAAAVERAERADAKLATAQDDLRRAQRRVAASGAGASGGRGAGALNRRRGPDALVAAEIARLQQAYLDSDDLTTLLNACIAALDEEKEGGDGARDAALVDAKRTVDRLTQIVAEQTVAVERAESAWSGKLDAASAETDPTRRNALFAEADQLAERYRTTELNAARDQAELDLALQSQAALKGDVKLSPLGEKCETQLLGDIQNALIAQQVRQTQLRALIAEQDTKLAAADASARAAELNACSTLLQDGDGAALDDSVEARAARLRCLNMIGDR